MMATLWNLTVEAFGLALAYVLFRVLWYPWFPQADADGRER